MSNLFIIGNGFDIRHGIHSRYQDFHDFLRSIYMNEILLSRSFDDFQTWRYDVPQTRNLLGRYEKDQITDVLGFLDYCISKSEKGNTPFNFYVDTEWNVIEETLGNLDLAEYFVKSEYYPASNYPAEFLLYDVAECFKFLPRILYLWVKQIDIHSSKPIPAFQTIIDPENDMFFTFNYTRTLEEIYGAKQVLHVHGEIGYRLLLGHAKNNDIDSFCERNYIPSCCRHAAKTLLNTTEKDTLENSKRLDSYYRFLDRGITDIYSYGFSFGEVDWPYIVDICKALDTSGITWHLSDFNDESTRNRFKDIIRHCGFRGTFSTFNIPNETKRKNKSKSPYDEYLDKQRAYLGNSRYEFNQILLDFYTIGFNRPDRYKQSRIKNNMFLRYITFFFYLVCDYVKNIFRTLFHRD